MKPQIQRFPPTTQGFALVVTLALMILLTVIAVGLLSLSVVSLRNSSQGRAQAEAQANARLALMIAIGELQKEMGPDMRVSAEAAIFDTDKTTEKIEGVHQPHWLASYNSWGGWLNGSCSPPDSASGPLTIAATYTPQREKMFRRWLLSLPDSVSGNVSAPVNISGWDDSNSVVLVGEGSLGASAQTSPEQVTRAYLNMVGDTGRSAWWIGPENHKARIDMAKQPRPLGNDEWESAQGSTAEVGVGALPGLGTLDANAALGDKLITPQSLRPAGVDEGTVQKHFFDITATSRGVIASVRTGHLKKDLSLLFEKPKAELPDLYRFDPGDVREPSIRPMSPEISGKAVLPGRHFASWTRMRHFYRMYRQDSDAEARDYATGGTGGRPALRWDGSKPWSDCNVSTYGSAWWGQDNYYRFPVLTNVTFIVSLKTEATATPGLHNLRYVASPVYVLWNPYNVELRMPKDSLVTRSYLTQVQTLVGKFYLGNTVSNSNLLLEFDADYARFMTRTPGDIVFKPGEFRIFTPEPRNIQYAGLLDILPGFDPQSFGGLYNEIGARNESEKPKLEVTFCNHSRAGQLFNTWYANTPGSFVFMGMWTQSADYTRRTLPFNIHFDWFNTTQAQMYAPITMPGSPAPWIFDTQLLPIGYMQVALKGTHNHDYQTIAKPNGWERDWRCRNWIQAPPFYLGKGLYMSEDDTIGHTQRIDSPYEMRFGPLGGAGKDVDDIIRHVGRSALLGIDERVTAAPSLELPSAPLGSLAGFAGMRMDPGWTDLATINSEWNVNFVPIGRTNTSGNALFFAGSKAWAYQSGITGPGIGNSFLHPIIPRTEVYRKFDNSNSMESQNFTAPAIAHTKIDTKAYCDYWDHVLLLNDALWDDYFVSSLADQTRPGASVSASLAENLQKLAGGQELANSRYMPYFGGSTPAEIKADLQATDGYLKAASHLMVDGMFNVNSTSVDAWHALFSGIRERQVVYRDKDGALKPVAIPSGKRIALSRFNTETTDQEGNDPEFGVTRDDGMQAWSGVRFLDDAQLRKLAEECVKQVKRRGPFLNFSEFINRRLSDDDLGTMGALQSAIDYDDSSPQAGSINYDFKSNSDFMLKASDLGTNSFSTPEAAVGSRFAGIPGYVIQSDLLNPIANTLSVRDDTFRIRAYGDSLDASGKVVARAWCEAIVQRMPEYSDESNAPEIPARLMSEQGKFDDNSEMSAVNRRFGRKFRIESFRWLSGSEI
jgi:hypothetical protein